MSVHEWLGVSVHEWAGVSVSVSVDGWVDLSLSLSVSVCGWVCLCVRGVCWWV